MIPAGVISLLAALVGVLMTWPMYAFGQITSDIHEMREKGISVRGGGVPAAPVSDPAPGKENPDELPEL